MEKKYYRMQRLIKYFINYWDMRIDIENKDIY